MSTVQSLGRRRLPYQLAQASTSTAYVTRARLGMVAFGKTSKGDLNDLFSMKLILLTDPSLFYELQDSGIQLEVLSHMSVLSEK